jgi:hypothetical protein
MESKLSLRFRASKVGALCTYEKGAKLTTIQGQQLKELEERDLKSQNNLLPQTERPKPLTAKMKETMEELRKKRDTPPGLSGTAKAYIRELWLERELGIETNISSKYMEKGLFVEEDSIQLLREVDGIFYAKNKDRKDDGIFTGHADVLHENKVIDIKSSWNAQSFMKASITNDYEWQLRVYMHLFNMEEAELVFCLVDCPEHLFDYEWHRYKLNNNIIDEESNDGVKAYENFRRTLMFADNNAITKGDRIKRFSFKRDDDKFDELLDRIPLALDYYETIKLNDA